MTNAGTPNYQTPAPKGGIPKWVIILIVVLGLVIFVCCGGVVTCMVLAKRVGTTVAAKAQEVAKEAQKRMDEEERRSAQAGGGDEVGSTPSAGVRTESGGATPSTPGEPSIRATRLPANFPSDVPVYSGMQPTYALSDKSKGTGHVIFTGSAKVDTVSSYYEKEMINKGWREETNTSINDGWVGIYSKDDRNATVSVSMDGDKTMVSVMYEKKAQ
jgi:hypothetical protein